MYLNVLIHPVPSLILGGSVLTVIGTGLDIGTVATVGLNATEDGEAGPDCSVL